MCFDSWIVFLLMNFLSQLEHSFDANFSRSLGSRLACSLILSHGPAVNWIRRPSCLVLPAAYFTNEELKALVLTGGKVIWVSQLYCSVVSPRWFLLFLFICCYSFLLWCCSWRQWRPGLLYLWGCVIWYIIICIDGMRMTLSYLYIIR